jgi:hypothetical protein
MLFCVEKHTSFLFRELFEFFKYVFLSFKGFSIYKFTLQIDYGALQVFPEHKGKGGFHNVKDQFCNLSVCVSLMSSLIFNKFEI